MRTKVLKTHVRKLRLDGNIGAYVGELAVVYFTGIKHTADWFLASFKENEVASGMDLAFFHHPSSPDSSAFIEWAMAQIEDFAEIFRKQVFTLDADPKLIEEALRLTHTQSRKVGFYLHSLWGEHTAIILPPSSCKNMVSISDLC